MSRVMSFAGGTLRLRKKCMQCGNRRAKLATAEGFCSYECSVEYEKERGSDRVALSIKRGRGGTE